MTNTRAIIDPMRRLIVLIGLAALAPGVEAASLNKCIDAQGKVTYSNLPCHNARETRTVEIDPAPPPVRSQAVRPQADSPSRIAVPKSTANSSETATITLETRRSAGKPVTHASVRQCDTIADKLGAVLDKMDQARRKGYTQKQMDAWDQDVKNLERKKQQSGCF